MDTTQNFGLKKPGADDFVDIDVLNENMDIIDEKCAKESWYGTCSTSYSMSAKVVTTTDGDFTLKAGHRVKVKFTNYNTTSSPTLNVDSTGAKYIKQYGTVAPLTYTWYSGEVVDFVYDGTYFIIADGGVASTSYYGVTKLSSSTTSTSTSLAATPSAVKAAYDRGTAGVNRGNEAYSHAELAHEKLNRNSWERSHIITIETSQNWTVPAGVYEVVVFLIGGGGGGGGYADNAGGGGGGGGYAANKVLQVTPGSVIPVTIGAGGTGGIRSNQSAYAQNGGTSSFGDKLLCAGGFGGEQGRNYAAVGQRNWGGAGGAGGGGGAAGDSTGSAGAGGGGTGEDGQNTNPANKNNYGLGGAGGVSSLKIYGGAFCPLNNTLYGGGGGGGAMHANFSDDYSSPGVGGAGGGGKGGDVSDTTSTSVAAADGYPGTLYGAGGGGGSRRRRRTASGDTNGYIYGSGGNGHTGVCIIAY